MALPGDGEDSHARFVESMVGPAGRELRLANIYLPNGNPPGSDNFEYKLRWMERLRHQMKSWITDEIPTVVGGDFNVIPEDIDCHKPASWAHDALFQPEPRAQFTAMLALGYVDAFRRLHPGQEGQFTYWDYFRQAFEKNRGIRIDHFLLSPGAAERLKSCEIDRTVRAQPRPSDHAPVVLELAE